MRLLLVRDLLQHVLHDAFGVIPRRIGADALFRPRRELHREVALEAEVGIGRQDQVVDLQALVGHLLLGAEHMRVVLREGAHAHQPVQRARRLVAVHRRRTRPCAAAARDTTAGRA